MQEVSRSVPMEMNTVCVGKYELAAVELELQDILGPFIVPQGWGLTTLLFVEPASTAQGLQGTEGTIARYAWAILGLAPLPLAALSHETGKETGLVYWLLLELSPSYHRELPKTVQNVRAHGSHCAAVGLSETCSLSPEVQWL